MEEAYFEKINELIAKGYDIESLIDPSDPKYRIDGIPDYAYLYSDLNRALESKNIDIYQEPLVMPSIAENPLDVYNRKLEILKSKGIDIETLKQNGFDPDDPKYHAFLSNKQDPQKLNSALDAVVANMGVDYQPIPSNTNSSQSNEPQQPSASKEDSVTTTEPPVKDTITTRQEQTSEDKTIDNEAKEGLTEESTVVTNEGKEDEAELETLDAETIDASTDSEIVETNDAKDEEEPPIMVSNNGTKYEGSFNGNTIYYDEDGIDDACNRLEKKISIIGNYIDEIKKLNESFANVPYPYNALTEDLNTNFDEIKSKLEDSYDKTYWRIYDISTAIVNYSDGDSSEESSRILTEVLEATSNNDIIEPQSATTTDIPNTSDTMTDTDQLSLLSADISTFTSPITSPTDGEIPTISIGNPFEMTNDDPLSLISTDISTFTSPATIPVTPQATTTPQPTTPTTNPTTTPQPTTPATNPTTTPQPTTPATNPTTTPQPTTPATNPTTAPQPTTPATNPTTTPQPTTPATNPTTTPQPTTPATNPTTTPQPTTPTTDPTTTPYPTEPTSDPITSPTPATPTPPSTENSHLSNNVSSSKNEKFTFTNEITNNDTMPKIEKVDSNIIKNNESTSYNNDKVFTPTFTTVPPIDNNTENNIPVIGASAVALALAGTVGGKFYIDKKQNKDEEASTDQEESKGNLDSSQSKNENLSIKNE